MRLRSLLVGTAALILGSQVGCCSWCEKHCPHNTGYAQSPPVCCQPCQPVCCQPAGSAPQGYVAPAPAAIPNYNNPPRLSQYPASGCGCP